MSYLFIDNNLTQYLIDFELHQWHLKSTDNCYYQSDNTDMIHLINLIIYHIASL